LPILNFSRVSFSELEMNIGLSEMPIERTKLGKSVKIWHSELVNIYDSEIGDNTKIAAFVEIGGAKIGRDCKIEAHILIPPGVTIGNSVFIGPHVCFTNDKFPRANNKNWELKKTLVGDGVSIGANCTILPGIVIGDNAIIGAGSIVCENVPASTVMYGSKAKPRRINLF